MSFVQNLANQLQQKGGEANYEAGDSTVGSTGYGAGIQQNGQNGGRRRRRGRRGRSSSKRRGFNKRRTTRRLKYGFLRSRSARSGNKFRNTFRGRFPALFDITKPRISKM